MQLREAVRKIHDDAVQKVRIHCDAPHAHAALSGCLSGNEDAITICKLCEAMKILLSKIDGLEHGLGSIHFKGMDE